MESARRRDGFPVDAGNSGELVECTGRSCKPYSATVVDGCVALCCCPCSVASHLFLTFLKVPWMVGRKCVRLLMIRKRKRVVVERKEMILVKEWEREVKRLGMDFHGEDDISSARFEVEKVWLELYQAGQVGFGRLSFRT